MDGVSDAWGRFGFPFLLLFISLTLAQLSSIHAVTSLRALLHVSQSHPNHPHQTVKDLPYHLLHIYFCVQYVSLKKEVSNDYFQCSFRIVGWALIFHDDQVGFEQVKEAPGHTLLVSYLKSTCSN